MITYSAGYALIEAIRQSNPKPTFFELSDFSSKRQNLSVTHCYYFGVTRMPAVTFTYP